MDCVESYIVKVLVVDDHTLFAEGTVSLLSSEPTIRVVDIAKNGQDCIRLASQKEPDIVLLDINLPDKIGSDLIQDLRAMLPSVKIIMLTGMDPGEYLNPSLRKGAQGFLLKDCSKSEMVQAIFSVFEGEVYVPPTLRVLHNDKAEENVGATSLSARESQIMEQVAKGLHNRDIAANLGIKIRTVDFHIGNILLKLGVNSRLEALLTWLRIEKNSDKAQKNLQNL